MESDAPERARSTPSRPPRAQAPKAPTAGAPAAPAPTTRPTPLPSVARCLAEPHRWRQRLVRVNGIEDLRSMAGAREALGILQLEPGRLVGEFLGHSLGALRVAVSHLNLAIRVWDRTPPHWRSFVFVRRQGGFGAFNGRPIRPGDMIAFPPDAPFDTATPRDYAWVAVELHPDVLAGALRRRGAAPDVVPEEVRAYRMGPQNYLRLERLCDEMLALQGKPVTRAMLEPLGARWTDLVAEGLASCPPLAPRVTTRALATHEVLTRAETYLHTHLDEPVYVEAVCAAAGASERNLQHGFRRRFGTSPIEYLALLRMHRVRDALCAARGRPDAQVGAIARHWVPGHLGRFAKDYRAHFGESPSQTLRSPRPADLPANAPPMYD